MNAIKYIMIGWGALSLVMGARSHRECILEDGHRVSLMTTSTLNERFPLEYTLSMQNLTQNSLDSYRVLMVVKRNQFLPFTPDNVHEYILRFSGTDDHVHLPLGGTEFALAVYKGSFCDDRDDREVLEQADTQHILHFDGQEMEPFTGSVVLTVARH